MPTNTFYRLPVSKKNRLIQAAWLEFSQYSFADSSINRIVQSAGIPRGSFYQYFTDKADLFLFLLQNTEHLFRKQLTHTFCFCQKDLPRTLLHVFDVLFLCATVPTASQLQVQQLLTLNPLLDWQPRISCPDDQSGLIRRSFPVETSLQTSRETVDLIFCCFSNVCKQAFFSPEKALLLRHELLHMMRIILHSSTM